MLSSRAMRLADGRLAFSATDLSRHLACGHLTSLRRGVALGEFEAPPPYDDPRGDVLKQRGIEHERRLLERFAAEGRSVAVVTAADTPFSNRDPAAAAARTRDAMRRGADVVYQGRLEDEDGRWSGYPDFLLRVDEPSRSGAWSYEVLDAKLARSAKGEAVLQLLLYSDLLALVQETEPARMHLALGGGDGRDYTSFRVVEYSAYYRAVRRRFETHADAPPETYPEPVEHCDRCEWKQSCAQRRRADDHLSLVAGITRGQRGRLVERGVTTMAALGALDLPVVPRLDGVGAGALARIRDQARVQGLGRREGRRIHELVTPVEPDKGLAGLPEPSAGDVFFDLEGDAFAADDGLEYLFGVADRPGRYEADWALDATNEKAAFERFVDRGRVPGRREPRPARRPAPARSAHPGGPPAPAPTSRPSAISWANRRPSTPPAASSSTTPGACTPTSAPSRRSSSTKGGSSRGRISRGRPWSGRGRWPDTACASCRSSTPATRTRRKRRPTASAALIRELLDAGAAWVDRQGVRKRLALGDVLVVAPYNVQVATLRARLPEGARVGTVDKFQGQEAPIVLYSMAT